MDIKIILPNTNYWSGELDDIFKKINDLVYGEKITLDFDNIRSFQPSGVMMLLLLTLEINKKTGNKVILTNIDQITKISLFKVGIFKFEHIQSNMSDFSYSANNENYNNFIPITRLSSYEEVSILSKNFWNIINIWFDDPILVSYCQGAWNILSELCNNGIEHSKLGNSTGECFCMVQKYSRGPYPGICITIGDIGVGIRAHLNKKFGVMPSSDSACIIKALSGVSGRLSGGGGMGLQSVRTLVNPNGQNSLIIRSGKGLLKMGKIDLGVEFKQSFPGTQINIILNFKD